MPQYFYRAYFEPPDLARIRLAYSPLNELFLSYTMLRRHSVGKPIPYGYDRWINRVLPCLDDVPLDYLDAVSTPDAFAPDFVLCPTPLDNIYQDIEDEFVRLRQQPDALILRDIDTLIEAYGDTDARRHFERDVPGALDALIRDMRLYWEIAIAPYWARIITLLEGDLLRRSRQLATEGPVALLTGLHPDLHYVQGMLFTMADEVRNGLDLEADTAGQGMLLNPSVFIPWYGGTGYSCDDGWQQSIGYRIDGSGLWLPREPEPPDEALRLTLGASKASILRLLEDGPLNSGEIARGVHVSAGSASQQLGKLALARLVTSYRLGHRVYYQLSPRGKQLLEVFK
jgi:DNA-binding HxlR family transcriptional regulator